MSSNSQLVEATGKYLIENYGRLPIAVQRGLGSRFWDADGKCYIDFFAGFGGAGVAGHCHPVIVEAVKAQAELLFCHGNLHTSAPQVELAEAITRHGFGGKVFFCHSGAEANEAAIKLMRLAARGGERKSDGPYKIISFDDCFHGRTMGSLSITPDAFGVGFEPMLPGSVKVPYGDLDAVRAAIDDETAGVFVEPIQAEGGMNIPTVEFMQGLRALCDEKQILLACDEVWTAPARTGKWYAYQHYGIEPDVMTLAKAIGGGTPLAAMVASPKYADVLVPGTHGCTMGGNPLCAAAAAAMMKLIEERDLVTAAFENGDRTVNAINDARIGCIKEIRYKGLMIGMEIDDSVEAKDLWVKCMDKGLWVCIAKNNVLRLAPALTIGEKDLAEGLEILISVLKS